jgi:hypothetical protein
MSRDKLDELLGVSLQWVHNKGLDDREIRKKILKMIKSFKRLKQTSEFIMCRHCLMESVSLLIPDRFEEEFKKQFMDVYEFNSVIY